MKKKMFIWAVVLVVAASFFGAAGLTTGSGTASAAGESHVYAPLVSKDCAPPIITPDFAVGTLTMTLFCDGGILVARTDNWDGYPERAELGLISSYNAATTTLFGHSASITKGTCDSYATAEIGLVFKYTGDQKILVEWLAGPTSQVIADLEFPFARNPPEPELLPTRIPPGPSPTSTRYPPGDPRLPDC